MDISLNDDQTLLRDTALSFAQSVLTPDRIRQLRTVKVDMTPPSGSRSRRWAGPARRSPSNMAAPVSA